MNIRFENYYKLLIKCMIVFEVSIKFWFSERITENTISYLYFKGSIISELQNRVTKPSYAL